LTELKNQDQEMVEGEKFDFEWPEDRFKELKEGQIIEAKVIIVRDDAVFVDIGGKSDLVIPVAELSNTPETSAKQLVKAGDVIKVMVTRTGGEDKILLSKRLVDQEQKWLQFEEAFKAGKPIQGTVSETVKSGLNVVIDGIRTFMPASQSGLSANLESLVGQTFPVRPLFLRQCGTRPPRVPTAPQAATEAGDACGSGLRC
jgi:4-hydroxy-3-methylbut-2-enyl diphosphate reductase